MTYYLKLMSRAIAQARKLERKYISNSILRIKKKYKYKFCKLFKVSIKNISQEFNCTIDP